nr:glycosyl transferase [Parabacteroides leei]
MTTLLLVLSVLAILSVFAISLYTGAVCIKGKGVPYSISATFYALAHKWWFRFTMWVTPILLMPAILEVSRPGIEFLAFLALIGMIMVGCAPDYARDPFQHKVHVSGAIMCIGFSQAWVALNCWWVLLPVWLAYLIYTIVSIGRQKEGVFLYRYMQTRPMFFVEVAALGTTYSALAILINRLIQSL